MILSGSVPACVRVLGLLDGLALVEAEQERIQERLVLDDDGDVGRVAAKLGRHSVDGVLEQALELILVLPVRVVRLRGA